MQVPRFVLLPLLSATLVAATCVTNVEQKGQHGPWVGEIVSSEDGHRAIRTLGSGWST